WNRIDPRSVTDRSARPTKEMTMAAQADRGGRWRNARNPRIGVRTTYRPVMKPAFVAVVRANPSVWRKYPRNIKAPRMAPGTRTSRPRRRGSGVALRKSGRRTRMAPSPRRRDHAMNGTTGRRRSASFVPGNVAPHMMGVRTRSSPASSFRFVRRATPGTIPQGPGRSGVAVRSYFLMRAMRVWGLLLASALVLGASGGAGSQFIGTWFDSKGKPLDTRVLSVGRGCDEGWVILNLAWPLGSQSTGTPETFRQ